MRLSTFKGGTARGALPREAFATLALPAAAVTELPAVLAEFEASFRLELAGVDAGVSVSMAACAVDKVLAPAEQSVWLSSLACGAAWCAAHERAGAGCG